jgi:hypothetical protein
MTEWRSVHEKKNLTFQPEALHHKRVNAVDKIANSIYSR